MADGVAITAGSGTTILTDDTGAGGHAQVVKLAISTDGSGTLIPAEATNGLDVDPTRHAPVVTGSGSLTASSQAVTLALNGEANVAFQLTGTWTATVTFEASNDGGTNWTSIYAYRAGDSSISQTVVNSTNNDIYRCTTAGFGQVRCRCSAYTSGTIVVTGIASARTSGVFVNFPLPPGTSKIGTVALENTNATLNSTSSDGGTALTSTAQAIKASAGKLKGYYIYNPNAAAAYVQFYNTAQASVTVGTTNPLFMLTIPPGSAANLWMESGVNFSTAMSWSATSTAGGNGAPTTALDAVAWYE